MAREKLWSSHNATKLTALGDKEQASQCHRYPHVLDGLLACIEHVSVLGIVDAEGIDGLHQEKPNESRSLHDHKAAKVNNSCIGS